MTTGHNSRTASRGNAGFSMIDVLVAITVLTVGLLALGVLQAGLTRNAADSRARSQLAAFSEGLIEQARSGGYDGVASATIVPKASGTAAEQAADRAQTAAGVSSLKTVQTATTYYANAAGSFSTTVPSGGGADAPQYKKLDVVTTWTDASGTNRTLTLNTIVSDLMTKDDKTPFNQQLAGPTNSAQFPVVRQDTPTGPGVIPIAVGDGSDTAATNPKPEISGTGKKASPIAGTTSYSVLTYQDAGNNMAEIQRRVETLVVSCKCRYGTASQATGVLAQPYRPTYWNGTRYVPPQPTKSDIFKESTEAAPPVAGEDVNLTTAQSAYCTECCRDHHDTATAKVKFDATRTSYEKYRYDSSNNLVAATLNTGSYVNACRLIRVDGIFHTATDLQSSHMGLLATQNTAKSPLPDTGKTTAYQNFVVDYLNSSYVTANPPAVSPVDANAIYAQTSRGLTAPDSIDITRTANDVRYLHGRGLYVDYLEEPAIAAIKRKCASNLTNGCVLPMLPFTTINTTELANWASGVVNTDALQVFSAPTCKDPTGQTNSTTDFPIRGCAAAGAVSGNGYLVATAVASMGRSNAGVAIARPVDPDDVPDRTTQQKFNVPASGGGSGGGGTGGTLKVSWAGLTTANYTSSTYPLVAWKAGTDQQGCVNSYKPSTPNPNPYTCQPSALTNVTITVGAPPVGSPGGYNTTVYTKGADPCANGNTNIPHCPKYQVSTVSVTPVPSGGSTAPVIAVVGTSGALSEGTAITFASLNSGDNISIGFKQLNVGADQATYQCVQDPNNANKKITQWTPCTP